jgi:hypothetical protein
MADGPTEIRCAVSDEAIDNAEGRSDLETNKRVDQFERLKARIVQSAIQKYHAGQFEPSGPLIMVGTTDPKD